MGSCNSGDHIAEDHIHTDITCNIEEPQQKYRLGTVSNGLLGGGGLNTFYWTQDWHDDMTAVSAPPDALGCMGTHS